MRTTLDSSGKAKNWQQLAYALGVDKVTVNKWRRDPRFAGAIPVCASDGRKDIASWHAFIMSHGLKDATPSRPFGGLSDDEESEAPIKFIPGNESEYKKLLTYEKIKQSQIETGKMEGVLLEAAQLEVQLGAAFIAITNRVSGLAETLAPLVVARNDVAEIMDIIRPETDSILAGLNTGDYLAEIPAIAATIDCSASERARLVELTETLLRGIGRAAIAEITRPSVVDPISGQARNGQTQDL